MRILVTGAAGFAGRHAVNELRKAGHEVIPTDVADAARSVEGGVPLDICDDAALKRVLKAHRPEGILHLGGVAFVPLGWRDPMRVFDVNLLGTLRLLECLREEAPRTRLVMVSSAEVYGRTTQKAGVNEDAPLEPANPYGVAKAAADRMTLLLAQRHALPWMTARPGNHIGAGQSLSFVAPSFAHQLAEISMGRQQAHMRVGNLDARRDFTDVRDIARAYRMMLEQGTPGQAYNVASGELTPVRTLLEILMETSGVHPRVERDPELYRPVDDGLTLDCARIRDDLGWHPVHPLRDTLETIYQAVLKELSGRT